LFSSHVSGEFIPPVIRGQIEGIATLAVIFFAFLTGLHVNLRSFGGRLMHLSFLGLTTVAVPFILGAMAAIWVWYASPAAVGAQAGQLTFVFAVAIALSVTALPVLSAILHDLELLDDPIGQWSLGLAAMNDGILWLLVSILLTAGVNGSGPGDGVSSVLAILMSCAYVGFMYGFARRALARWFANRPVAVSTDALIVGATAFMLLSALVTEALGLHYLLGAFVAGTVLPGDIQSRITDRLEHVLTLMLSPFFFVATGLKVNLDSQMHDILPLFLILTAATMLGKYIGTVLPARLIGMGWKDSLALGSLMQAKGMMELAVLTILHDAGMISGLLFSALTLMTLVTTALSMTLTRAVLVFHERVITRRMPAE
jgi:Kef-type K+ transport system membrane component KefB